MTDRNHERLEDTERYKGIYADIKAVPPLIVRADGRNFKRVLSADFAKPYDERFARGMAKATTLFFEKSGFDPKLAYLFSDEINIFFPHVPFKGRIEKLNSIISSFLASALTIVLNCTDPIAFDARIIPACGVEDMWGYLVQRQAEAWRNHLNAYGYYGLQELGLSDREAEQHLKGMKAAEVHEMLFRKGINLNETPQWQRRGIVITREQYQREGYDKKAETKVTVTRSKIVEHWDLPLFGSEEGRNFIARRIGVE